MKKQSSSSVRSPDETQLLTNVESSVTVVAQELNRLLNDYFGESAVQKIVSYFRVSTIRQGQSGLGLEGQQAAVDAFVSRRGCEVIASYTEVESGKKSERPELAKALAHAKRSKAVLVVAKLDRLARNLHFMSSLMESNVEFVAIDLENANRLTIHLLSAIAEGEAAANSSRTKAALQAAKVRGVKLGSARPGHWDGREDARAEGQRKAIAVAAVANKQAADEAYSDLLPVMRQLQTEGKSLRAIAEFLNQSGHTTRRGKTWNPVQVGRVLGRLS